MDVSMNANGIAVEHAGADDHFAPPRVLEHWGVHRGAAQHVRPRPSEVPVLPEFAAMGAILAIGGVVLA